MVYGNSGANVQFYDNSNTANYFVNAANSTINASGATNNVFYAGDGNESLGGAATGVDSFFLYAASAARTVQISDFHAADVLYLTGVTETGSNQASGSTFVSLSDGTTIALWNYTGAVNPVHLG